MTWLRRTWQKLRGYPEARAQNLVPLELRVYKVGAGELVIIVGDEGMVSLTLSKAHTLALIDTLLDTVGSEAADPPLAS